ncbi:MAG: hypothetical protein JXA73_04135 [Acidobacteria bacterium]|nr:hypothetical protein [Acidobacteriota bacterium]
MKKLVIESLHGLSQNHTIEPGKRSGKPCPARKFYLVWIVIAAAVFDLFWGGLSALLIGFNIFPGLRPGPGVYTFSLSRES